MQLGKILKIFLKVTVKKSINIYFMVELNSVELRVYHPQLHLNKTGVSNRAVNYN